MSSTVWRPFECFQEKSGNIYQIIYYLETVWKISWSDMTEDVYVFLYLQLYHHHENCSNDNFAFLSFFSLQMLEYLIISTFLCIVLLWFLGHVQCIPVLCFITIVHLIALCNILCALTEVRSLRLTIYTSEKMRYM